jgi:hypothetical protein
MFENNIVASLKTVRCSIVNISPSRDGYTVMIVETTPLEFLPITIPFNYEFNIKVGDKGMLTYEEAIAGMTKWWSSEEEKYYTHNYTAYYYKHFLHEVSTIDGLDTLYVQ